MHNAGGCCGGKIYGNKGVVQEKYRIALNPRHPENRSTAAELRVAKYLKNNKQNVYFIDNNIYKGAKGPGISNDFVILSSGRQADVKLLSGIGSNAAKNISKGVSQVGNNGIVYVVRSSDSKLTMSQFQEFINGFKPKNPSVTIKLLNESDLPKLKGQ